MKLIRYKNAIIRISGEVDRDKIEKAAIRFIKRADLCKKNRKERKNQNGNVNSSRAISKQ